MGGDFDVAIGHHRRGELAAALPLYERIIAEGGTQAADAVHMSALIHARIGSPDTAVARMTATLQRLPDSADVQVNIANVMAEVWHRITDATAPADLKRLADLAAALAPLLAAATGADAEAAAALRRARIMAEAFAPLRDALLAPIEARACAAVVIPVYNMEMYLERAIGSAIASIRHARTQGLAAERFAIIVVDDASIDGSRARAAAILEAAPDVAWNVVALTRNQGQAACRNLGVSQADAEFILFLDADDHFLPPHVLTCVRTLRADPQAAFVRTDMVTPYDRVNPDYKKRVVETSPINLCVRRAAFLEMGGFPRADLFRRAGGEDCHLAIQMARRFKGIAVAAATVAIGDRPDARDNARADITDVEPRHTDAELPLVLARNKVLEIGELRPKTPAQD